MGVVGETEVTSRMLSPSEKRLMLGSHRFCVVYSLPSGPQSQSPSKFPPGKMDGQSFKFTVMEVKTQKKTSIKPLLSLKKNSEELGFVLRVG